MWFAVLGAELLALIAVAFVLRRGASLPPEHKTVGRPLLALLVVAVVVDVLIAMGDCRVLGDPHAALASIVPCVPPAPRSGLTSAVRLAEQALVMAWPAALATAALRVFGGTKGQRPEVSFEPPSSSPGASLWPGRATDAARNLPPAEGRRDGQNTVRRISRPVKWTVVAWTGAIAVLVLARPYGHPGDTLEARQARAEVVAHGLLGFDLLAVAVGLAAVVLAWTPGRRWARSPPHQAVLVLLVTEAAVALIGPFVRDPFAEWDYARALYLPGFVVVAGILLRAVLRRIRSPR